MNALETWLETKHFKPNRVLNYLKEHGIVSDNCITLHDVADVDCKAAIQFLTQPKK